MRTTCLLFLRQLSSPTRSYRHIVSVFVMCDQAYTPIAPPTAPPFDINAVFLAFERCVALREDLSKAERKSALEAGSKALLEYGQPPSDDDSDDLLSSAGMRGASMSQGTSSWQPAHVTGTIYRGLYPNAGERARVLFANWVPPAQPSPPPLPAMSVTSFLGGSGATTTEVASGDINNFLGGGAGGGTVGSRGSGSSGFRAGGTATQRRPAPRDDDDGDDNVAEVPQQSRGRAAVAPAPEAGGTGSGSTGRAKGGGMFGFGSIGRNSASGSGGQPARPTVASAFSVAGPGNARTDAGPSAPPPSFLNSGASRAAAGRAPRGGRRRGGDDDDDDDDHIPAAQPPPSAARRKW